MILKECMLVKNDCYIKGEKMTDNMPTGIVVHSTGANNKTIKRYVQPVTSQAYYDEVIADIGKNAYGNHWNRSSEEMGRSSCVHAFIGVNTSGVIETYQTLPFDICCWGVGTGKKGSYNYNPTARVQFEICEDDLSDENYFNSAMKEAQEFCAFLCKTYGFGVDKICSHNEAYDAGYSGSNHGDPDHWLEKFGKSMTWFRQEVEKILSADKETVYRIEIGDFSEKSDAQKAVEDISAKGYCTRLVEVSTISNSSGNELEKEEAEDIKIGDKVRLSADAVTYSDGKKFSSWVYDSVLYVRQLSGNRAVISTVPTGDITGSTDKKYLIKI